MPYNHILRAFDSDSMIDRFSSMGSSILLYTIWRLCINLTKNNYPERADDAFSGNIHLSFFDIEENSSIPITQISQYLTIFESLLLIGAIDEIEFRLVEHVEQSDSTKEFLNVKISKDDIRKESYDTMLLWEAGRDNADIICYISTNYKLNLGITKKLIEASILKWENNKTTNSKIDFWTSTKQLEVVGSVLVNGYETFGNRRFEIKKVDLSNNINIDLFATLLYLSNKRCIKLYECGRSVHGSDKIPAEFFVEILDINELRVLLGAEQPKANTIKAENTKIIGFLEKIENCKKLLSEGVLETRKEQDLIAEIRAFAYETIIDNEILLLKIKKLKAHPQSIWSSHSSRGFSNNISPYILEWEGLFQEYTGKKDAPSISNQIKNVQNDGGRSKIEDTNKITGGLGLDSANIVRITPYINYVPGNKEFLNPNNGAKYKLKEEYSRQIIELLIFKNEHKVISFVKDNKAILCEFKKGKRGGGKWGTMHTFLQSKIKNITEKIEYHLKIDKDFRSNFLTCNKENIAIKISLK